MYEVIDIFPSPVSVIPSVTNSAHYSLRHKAIQLSIRYSMLSDADSSIELCSDITRRRYKLSSPPFTSKRRRRISPVEYKSRRILTIEAETRGESELANFSETSLRDVGDASQDASAFPLRAPPGTVFPRLSIPLGTIFVVHFGSARVRAFTLRAEMPTRLR